MGSGKNKHVFVQFLEAQSRGLFPCGRNLEVTEMDLDLPEGVLLHFSLKTLFYKKGLENSLISHPEGLISITGLYKSLTESCFLRTVNLF